MEDGDEEDRRARRREEVARQELEQIDPEKEQQETYQPGFGKEEEGRSTECPYLDTVNRHALDFDFEKRCSVSLSTHNVYCCLVCGQYFQGRGKGTHAHTHSLEALHHVFMNLRTGQVYCLPEGYEVVDPSLEDIRHVLHPKFTKSQVEQLDRSKRWSRGLDGTEYLPGTIGLNNLKATDYVNAVLQGVMRVTPVRNFFLVESNYASVPSPLVQRFGELVRKVWNSRNFKGQVSPHEFMQAVSTASSKRFQPDRQSDPVEFLSWLLHALHSDLTGGKPNKKHSVISRAFQGRLEVVPLPDESANQDQAAENGQTTSHFMPFWMLGLDLPPPPLFQDSMEKNIIPQVPLYDILKKFDGEQVYEQVRAGRKKFRIAKLPPYLILHYKRFTKNNFFVEKNPTIVTFPVRNLELKECIPVPKDKQGREVQSKYDLVGNICHDGKPYAGSYRAHVYDKGDGNWFETQDLNIREVLPQQVALSETYLQIYEQHSSEERHQESATSRGVKRPAPEN